MNQDVNVAELDFDGLLAREWLVTNPLGASSSSTLCGLNTRRYHGLLVAAMSPPVRRMVLLSRVEETVRGDGRDYELAANEYPGTIWPRGHEMLRAFSTDPHPRWAYQADGWTLQKEVRLLRDENAVLVSYTLLGGCNGGGMDLEIRPLLALRGTHELSYQWNGKLAAQPRGKSHWHVPATCRTPELFFAHDGQFENRGHWYLNQIYRREAEYGYPGLEDLWSPGAVHVRLSPGQTVHFACSADPLDLGNVVRRADREVHDPDVRLSAGHRSLAGAPAGSSAAKVDPDYDALVGATGDAILTAPTGGSYGAVAQHHWSPPSVRAAVAGFTGLFLVPNRLTLGRSLLVTLAGRVSRGLLPAELPADGSAPVYRSADVSLWFVNAVHQYLLYSGDEWGVRRQLLPAVTAIIDAYRNGTDHNIRTDPDGLLCCGRADVATTWMDTSVNGVPVNPRHGRPVEVNALWYNALLSAAALCRRFDRSADADSLESLAARTRDAFNRRFWNAAEQCCFDVVGDAKPGEAGVDAAIRPNQLLAVSLPFPVLSPDRWRAVVDRVSVDLLVPTGVRTLSPRDHRYVGRYAGPQHDRDRAAHNGSAYPWLLGPLVTATVRAAAGRDASAAWAMLAPCLAHLRGAGVGHLFELSDGNAPHAPGGALASPLAAAELLRCYAEDLLNRHPRPVPKVHVAVG